MAFAMTFAAAAEASTITPDIIWGSGNVNRGFTVETTGSLELGIRAKQRFPASDAIGVGIVQDVAGNYLFDSSTSTAPAGRAMWSFDWSVNTNVDGVGGNLNMFTYLIEFDTDATVNENYSIAYDPFSNFFSGYYLGTNATTNGEEDGNEYNILSPGDLALHNVAQNSVQPQWIGGPTGSGQFGVRLSAFDGGVLVGSVEIQAIVDDPAPIPLPAAMPLLLAGIGGLGAFARRRRKS
ncbi:VPLPA-CTERM sorting domain-containing protein [Poseidonocella sedimentorum]|nr:VPLPA-CTERM sorting domain-containing protein [Poseidonocella sedimentorum]